MRIRIWKTPTRRKSKRYYLFKKHDDLFLTVCRLNLFPFAKDNDYIDTYFDNGEDYADDDGGGDDEGPVY